MHSPPLPAERSPLLRRTGSSSPSSSTIRESVEEYDGKTGISSLRGTIIVLSIGILIFLQATNVSILTTTQSSIAADLDAFENTIWLTSSYLIAMSSLAPLMGRLCQVFSPRLCMLTSTAGVCIGTVITSLSSTFEMFILGRVITGAGAGGIMIMAAIIVIQIAGDKSRGLHIGLINACMTVGVSLGAVIGGALEPKVGWKVLFAIQSPIAFLCGCGILLGIPFDYVTSSPENRNLSLKQKLSKVDYSGAILLTSTIVLFLLGLSGPHIQWTPLVLSTFLLPLFILNEIYMASDPVIPIKVLKSRGVLLSCLATMGFMMTRWTILFYTPVYALAVRGWSGAAAGSILIPTNAGFGIGGILAGAFHIRRAGSFYLPSLIAMVIAPFTFLVLAFISTPASPWVVYMVAVFINGLLTGATLNYTLVHLLHLTPASVHPIALSLLATFRGFSGSFGSAIGGGFFERVLRKSLINGFEHSGYKPPQDLIRRVLGSPPLVQKLHGIEKAVAVAAYQSAIKTLFVAAIGIGIIVVAVQAGTGWKEATDKEEGVLGEEDVEEEVSAGDTLVAGS